jgi:hypothetical protein
MAHSLPFALLTTLLLSGHTLPSAAAASAALPVRVKSDPGIDSCLIGVWQMDVYALNNKFQDAAPNGLMQVMAPSEAMMEFSADHTFRMSGQVTMRGDIPNSGDYIEIDGAYQGSGAYTVGSGQISFLATEYVMDYGDMRAVINGQPTSGAFGAAPNWAMSPPKDARYTCTGNSLQVSYDGPAGPIVEEWRR